MACKQWPKRASRMRSREWGAYCSTVIFHFFISYIQNLFHTSKVWAYMPIRAIRAFNAIYYEIFKSSLKILLYCWSSMKRCTVKINVHPFWRFFFLPEIFHRKIDHKWKEIQRKNEFYSETFATFTQCSSKVLQMNFVPQKDCAVVWAKVQIVAT